jgi:hypothetical protein
MLASSNKKNDPTIHENIITNKSPGISSFEAPQLFLIELHSYFAQVNVSLLVETVITVWISVFCAKLII